MQRLVFFSNWVKCHIWYYGIGNYVTLVITALGSMTLSFTAVGKTALGIMAMSVMTFGIRTLHQFHCYKYLVTKLLSIDTKDKKLSSEKQY